jgi:hypothetical protein
MGRMIALGKIPDAGPRCYAIGGELPEDVLMRF